MVRIGQHKCDPNSPASFSTEHKEQLSCQDIGRKQCLQLIQQVMQKMHDLDQKHVLTNKIKPTEQIIINIHFKLFWLNY